MTCFSLLTGEVIGDGGRAILEGDLNGDGRFVARSERGCFASDAEVMPAAIVSGGMYAVVEDLVFVGRIVLYRSSSANLLGFENGRMCIYSSQYYYASARIRGVCCQCIKA